MQHNAAVAIEYREPEPMAPSMVADLVCARLEDGPATLGMLVAAVSKQARIRGESSGGAIGVLTALFGLGASVACARARIKRKTGSVDTLVWLRAEDKAEHVRREAGRRARERAEQSERHGTDAKPQLVILSFVEDRPGAHSSKGEAPTPLEIIARLAGCTTYKEPGLVRSTRPGMTTDEIDFVLSHVGEPLGEDMARTIACHSALSWPRVRKLAYPYLLEKMGNDHQLADLARGKRRARIQLVLHHVYHDLAAHRRRGDKAKAAEECALRLQTYIRAYRFIEKELTDLATTAAEDAIDNLMGRSRSFATTCFHT